MGQDKRGNLTSYFIHFEITGIILNIHIYFFNSQVGFF